MLRTILLALLLAASASAQTLSGGSASGTAFGAAGGGSSGGSGGAGTGVETRYVELQSDPHLVASCSEPLDGGDDVTHASPDSTLSPDESECWGRGGNWQNATYQDDGGMTIEAVTGWGSVGFAAQQDPGGDWWLAYKPTAIASDFSLTEATVCVRYYKQVASDYSTASFNCGGGTTRNKLTEIDNERPGSPGLYDAFQMQEDQHDGCATIANGRGIMACYGSGPADEPGCVWLSPTVQLLQAVSQPIRVEQCFETTNIATGENMVVHALVTRLDTGVTSSHSTPSGLTLGPLANDSTSFGDIDHTGSGIGWHGYFMFAIWDDINGHTIGAACEIEGGC